jgi:hypothetical protein
MTAQDSLRLLGITLEYPGRDPDLARRLSDPLAVLAAEQHAERLLIRLDPPRDCLEDLEAPVGRQTHPDGTVLRRGDCPGDVGGGRAGHSGDLLACGGVERRVDCTVGSARPGAVDQHFHRGFPSGRLRIRRSAFE